MYTDYGAAEFLGYPYYDGFGNIIEEEVTEVDPAWQGGQDTGMDTDEGGEDQGDGLAPDLGDATFGIGAGKFDGRTMKVQKRFWDLHKSSYRHERDYVIIDEEDAARASKNNDWPDLIKSMFRKYPDVKRCFLIPGSMLRQEGRKSALNMLSEDLDELKKSMTKP